MNLRSREPLSLLLVGILMLAWSGVAPKDRTVWLMEVFPAIAGAVALGLTFRRFPLTPVVYRLVFVFSLVLMVGGKYTYAEVPLGNWVRDALHAARNDYDRLGHFAQGFVPAILSREVLLRKTPLRRGGWLFFLTCSTG